MVMDFIIREAAVKFNTKMQGKRMNLA